MAGTRPETTRTRADPIDLLDVDALLTDEERMIRDTVRGFVKDRVLPVIDEWFEHGHFDKSVVKELGALGLLGMHLHGYGCAGTNAVSYGLACLELDRIGMGLAAPDLPLLGEPVVQERFRGRRRLRAADEKDGEEEGQPSRGAAQARVAPAEKEGRPHSFFCLGGFTTLAPAFSPGLASRLRESCKLAKAQPFYRHPARPIQRRVA